MFTVTIGPTTTTVSCPLVETMAAEVTEIHRLLTEGGPPPPSAGQIHFTIGPVREKAQGGKHGSGPQSDAGV